MNFSASQSRDIINQTSFITNSGNKVTSCSSFTFKSLLFNKSIRWTYGICRNSESLDSSYKILHKLCRDEVVICNDNLWLRLIANVGN